MHSGTHFYLVDAALENLAYNARRAARVLGLSSPLKRVWEESRWNRDQGG
jgi:hypothetical protein